MATYVYPVARELRQLGADLMAQETLNDPLLTRILPMRSVNTPMLQWTVDDDDLGLQQLRGLDGSPLHVQPLGRNTYLSEPGYFGEFETITERELTTRGGSIMGEGTVDVTDLVAAQMRQLTKRQVARIRQIGWALLTTGTFSVSGKGGTLTFTDTFTLQTYSASDWSVTTTATPKVDFQAVQQLGSQYGVNFGSGSVAVMNRVTANYLLSNTYTGAGGIGGLRTLGGGTINSVPEINRILLGEDLPEIVVVDDGYKNDSGTFTRFVPTDKVIVMGMRNAGDAIGEYRLTRNMNNPTGAPGTYEYIKDYIRGVNAPKETPPRIETHMGHNGGPVIFRPKAIVIMSV